LPNLAVEKGQYYFCVALKLNYNWGLGKHRLFSVGCFRSVAYMYNYCKYIVKELIFYPLKRLMEERKFLYTLCSRALGMDDTVIFAGVVNDYGKLIVVLTRLFANQKYGIMDDGFFKSTPGILCRSFSHNSDGLYSVKNMKNSITCINMESRSYFQLIDVAKNKYIAFSSLTDIHDKYLCIYFEANKSVSDTILKLYTVF